MQNDEFKKELLEKAFKFSVRILNLSSILPKNPAGYALANQLVRSGTSIGANLQEAQSTYSRKDFASKISISLKEARETGYWIDLILESELLSENKLINLRQECEELIKILVSVSKKLKINS